MVQLFRSTSAADYFMSAGSHLESEMARVQTAKASLRWRALAVFIALIVALVFVAFINHEVRRIYYGALSAAAAVALIVQYSREHALVRNRLLTVAVVTDWGRPVRSRSRAVDAILSRLSGNIPVMRYSFVAFDQKTYTGQTGWGGHRLYVGARIPILHNPEKPAANHPLTSFVFYSFR